MTPKKKEIQETEKQTPSEDSSASPSHHATFEDLMAQSSQSGDDLEEQAEQEKKRKANPLMKKMAT